MKQLAIIKIPGFSKAATMEAKGNYLANAAARQAALNSQIVQTCECSLLPNKSIKTLFYGFNGRAAEDKRIWQQKGEILSQTKRYGLDPIRKQSYLEEFNYYTAL